jgi:hypothetical protein
VFGAEVGNPVPAKDAFDTDNDIIDVGKHQFEEQFRIGFYVLVDLGFAFLVDDTDIHFSSVQIDTAIVLVLLFVKSHGLASFG